MSIKNIDIYIAECDVCGHGIEGQYSEMEMRIKTEKWRTFRIGFARLENEDCEWVSNTLLCPECHAVIERCMGRIKEESNGQKG